LHKSTKFLANVSECLFNRPKSFAVYTFATVCPQANAPAHASQLDLFAIEISRDLLALTKKIAMNLIYACLSTLI